MTQPRQQLSDEQVAEWRRASVISPQYWLATDLQAARGAVQKHHDQHADDLCWMDDNELYAAFGLPPREPTVGDPVAMLENCKRYVTQRCKPGGTWQSYAELEQENATLKAGLRELRADLPQVCTCQEAYKGRGKRDPECSWCKYGEYLTERIDALVGGQEDARA